MKPKVVIISKTKKASKILKQQLVDILGDMVDFHNYSIEEGISGKIYCDLCIVPTEDISNTIAEKLFPGTKIMSIKRTLLKDKIYKVSEIPSNTKVLVVNTSKEFVQETISTLLEMGVNYVDFYPYYPGIESYPEDVKIAVTPGEIDLVPKSIEKVIDIGDRVIDSESIFNIINHLNLFNDETKNILLDYMLKISSKNLGFFELLKNSNLEKEFMKEILEAMNVIIIIYNDKNIITYNNKNAMILSNTNMNGYLVNDLFDNEILLEDKDIKNEVIQVKGNYYNLKKKVYFKNGKVIGGIIALRDYNTIKKEILSYNKRTNVMNFNAKYTFEDILGNSIEIKKTKERAKRAAKTDLDILIEGETGTGKELFAHSIHNESNRKEGPFVAFNCAALSNNLLESELFGYDDGAFTGARKGGKMGFIELANHGTLFLDEIGEITENVQVKLLRVLQEREIIRVGGTKRIPIDVRVIAATNKNLIELVKEGKFRKDLYFRLNVLTIKIPPLRKRKGDCLFLISHILRNRNLNYEIPKEIIDILEQYNWPGNVRELQNYCETIINMEEEFSISTLPENIAKFVLNKNASKPIIDQNINILGEKRKREKYEILKIINTANNNGEKIGRKTIVYKLNEKNIKLGIQEVRTLLYELEEKGLVEIYKGRTGTVITDMGKRLLYDIQQDDGY